MSAEEKKKTLKERILQEISSGQVSMRPRLFFALRLAALALLSAAAVGFSIFVFNVLVFGIHAREHGALLGFGWYGWQYFFRYFPWATLLLGILSVVLLGLLLRRFRFGYETPALYVLGGLAAAALLFGSALERTRFNKSMYEIEEHLPSPVIGLYEHARRPLPSGSGVCKGRVLSIEGDKLTVQDLRSGSTTLTVILGQEGLREAASGLRVGDTIFIAGWEEDGSIRAFGLRRLP